MTYDDEYRQSQQEARMMRDDAQSELRERYTPPLSVPPVPHPLLEADLVFDRGVPGKLEPSWRGILTRAGCETALTHKHRDRAGALRELRAIMPTTEPVRWLCPQELPEPMDYLGDPL